jgi:hypothetical protein
VTDDRCERESSVVAATRAGESTLELENHLTTCASCAETKYVSRSLLQHAATTSVQRLPPAPKRIWRKMQERKQQFARRRAARGLTVMWTLATVYFVALSAHYLFAVWRTQSAQLEAAVRFLDDGMTLAGIAIAVTSVALGSGYLLVSGRQIDTRLL